MKSDQKLTFAVLTRDSGWWTLAEVTQKILAHEGLEVELVVAPREDRIARVDRGEFDFGANARFELDFAYNGTGPESGQQLRNIRAIASIHEANWWAFAVTRETRLISIEQIKERQFPLRIYGPYAPLGGGSKLSSEVFFFDRIFEEYLFSRADIESWGGKILHANNGGNETFREHNFDAIFMRAYPGSGPVGRRWQEASNFNNLRFLRIREDILEKISAELGLTLGVMPGRLLRGMEEDILTIYEPYRSIFVHAGMPDEMAFLTAKSFDEHSLYFLQTHLPLAYSPLMACRNTGIPLHPGAEEYYRSKGYL
jgi:uncharacterized protein